jgi:hypothetical protein
VKGIAVLALCAALVAGCGGSGPSSSTRSLTVKIEVLRHGKQVLAVVPVTIDGKGPYRFALDTGASQSLVDTAVAKELKAPKTGVKQRIAGIASVSKLATITVARWSIGSVRLPPTTVIETNLPFGNADGGVQGLLGSDMLSQFDTITIDYDHSRLVLHHRAVHVTHG